MTIRFTTCPYHEPSAVGYERTMVVDDSTRQFKCATCDASGTLNPAGPFPGQHVAPVEVVTREQLKARGFTEETENA